MDLRDILLIEDDSQMEPGSIYNVLHPPPAPPFCGPLDYQTAMAAAERAAWLSEMHRLREFMSRPETEP